MEAKIQIALKIHRFVPFGYIWINDINGSTYGKFMIISWPNNSYIHGIKCTINLLLWVFL